MNDYRALNGFRFLIPVFVCALCLNLSAQEEDPGPPPDREAMRARMESMSEEERAAFRSEMRERFGNRGPGRSRDGQSAGSTSSDAALETQAGASAATVNWENITLKDCIETLCRDLQMEFIISPSVNVAQEVSVRAGDITAWKSDNKLQLFDAILETAGVQRIQRGRVWVFSPSKLRPVVSSSDNDLSGGTAIIGVLRVQHITAARAANILNEVDGKPQRIFPQDASSTLLVSGTKDYLAQTEELLKLIDVPPAVLTHFMIQHADATDLSTELNALFTSRTGGDGSAIQFIPITRLNMIVAHNAPESMHEEIRNWIKILDSADGANERITRVYRIQVIDAVSIADTLSSLYSDLHDQAQEKQDKYGTQKNENSDQKSGTKTASDSKSNSKSNSQSGSNAASSASASKTGDSSSFDYAEDEIIILADEDTNTLIVNAPLEAHREIAATLTELDRARKQVLIETVVVEVTLDESTEFGMEWAAQFGDSVASQLTGIDPTISQYSNISGLVTNASNGLTYLLSSSDNILTMIHAAQEDNRLQVLSSPTVLARDGMEASISFGDEVPVEQETVDDGVTSITYDYRDAKISLTVTPHIDDNRMVTLELEQEISQVSEDSTDEAPTFSTREISTSLQVFDNQTLVLGGLIQREDTNYSTGIPILSKIPLIKYFFSNTYTGTSGTEIMMIITPRVIENTQQANSLTTEYRNKVLGSLDVDDIRKVYNLNAPEAGENAEEE